MDENPYAFIPEHNAETGERSLRAEVRKESPPQFGLLIGDCVHNLRSSLDHLVWQLGLKLGATPANAEKVAFPIYINPTGSRSFQRGSPAKIGHLPRPVQDRIEQVQPYNRGNNPQLYLLWVLHDLWNTDKHQDFRLTGFAAFEGRIESLDPGLVPQGSHFKEGAFHHGDIVAYFLLTNPTEAERNFEVGLSFDVAFSGSGPAHGLRVTTTLREMHEVIRNEVLTRFVSYLR